MKRHACIYDILFSPSAAQVKVCVERCADDTVRFSVSDEGAGIAQNQLHKLFGLFQQLDLSDSRPTGGTGLGLAISRGIVEQHGGTIGVETAAGQGAMFWFELPSTKPAHRDDAVADTAVPAP